MPEAEPADCSEHAISDCSQFGARAVSPLLCVSALKLAFAPLRRNDAEHTIKHQHVPRARVASTSTALLWKSLSRSLLHVQYSSVCGSPNLCVCEVASERGAYSGRGMTFYPDLVGSTISLHLQSARIGSPRVWACILHTDFNGSSVEPSIPPVGRPLEELLIVALAHDAISSTSLTLPVVTWIPLGRSSPTTRHIVTGTTDSLRAPLWFPQGQHAVGLGLTLDPCRGVACYSEMPCSCGPSPRLAVFPWV